MKKTEILRFRVDINTQTALTRHCQITGQSLSYVLRKSIESFIESNGPSNTADCMRSEFPASDETRRRYACSVATILIAGHSSLTEQDQRRCSHKHREVARLVDALFRALCASEARPLACASPETRMDYGAWALPMSFGNASAVRQMDQSVVADHVNRPRTGKSSYMESLGTFKCIGAPQHPDVTVAIYVGKVPPRADLGATETSPPDGNRVTIRRRILPDHDQRELVAKYLAAEIKGNTLAGEARSVVCVLPLDLACCRIDSRNIHDRLPLVLPCRRSRQPLCRSIGRKAKKGKGDSCHPSHCAPLILW
jgi:hypothetical protein